MKMYIYKSIFYLLWHHLLIHLTKQNSGFSEFSPLGDKIAVAVLFFDEMLLYTLTVRWRNKAQK